MQIILKTTNGKIELSNSLEEDLNLLTEVNDGSKLIKLYVKLELGCTISAAQASGPRSLLVSQTTSDAFSVLMNNQRVVHQNRGIHEKLGLPERREEQTGKDKVHNKLIEYCIDKSISLNKRSIEKRNRAWKSLLNILWKLNEVGKKRAQWQEKPPIDLDLFLGHSFYDVSNNRGKKKRPSLTQSILSDLINEIKSLQTEDWLEATSNVMPTFLDGLLISFKAQMSECVDQAQRMSTLRVQSSYQSIWKDLGPGDLAKDHRIEVDQLRPSKDIPEKYRQLNEALEDSSEYEGLMIHEYMDGTRNDRLKYRKGMRVGCYALLLQVKHPGSIRDDFWIFKVDPEAENHLERFANTTKNCIRKSSRYVDSWVCKAFQNLPVPGCDESTSLSNLREYFRIFAGDSTEANTPQDKKKRALIELSIQTADQGLLEDARKMNRRQECHDFQEFWKLTQEHLNGVVDAAHARRHGVAETGYLSDILSCRELHETVKMRLQEELGDDFDETLVPSLSTLYLQFIPSSNRLLTQARFKSRFAVQMKVQKRILHIDHCDAHYGNAIIKYLRSFAARFRDVCSFFSADDKARINIGPPGVFVQSGVRNKPQLAPVGVELLALDHDYDGTCLVPSVYLKHEIPDIVAGDWYKGSVTVGLKDGVFQKSCPWRHAEELYRQYQNSKTPILMLLTDGGPDRMLKRATVMAAQIALFLSLDLDMLIVSRTVPHLSFRNPVERVMSTLNYALQNVSLCREGSPSSILEQELKGCNSMSSIRERAKTFPEGEEAFKSLFRSSLQKATRKISERMSRLNWKGESIGMYEAGGIDNISLLVEKFLETDPQYSDAFKRKCRGLNSLDWSELQRKESPIKEFISKHVRQSPYVLQMKKIDGCSCTLCRLDIIKPPRLDTDTFFDLKWLPLPLQKPLDGADGEVHYKDFEDLYGLEPNHKHQPSLKKSNAASKGEHGLYTGNRARSFVQCSSCSRPRVIYVEGTNQRLTKADKAFISRINEEGHYVCGSEVSEFIPSLNQENEVVNLTGEENSGEGHSNTEYCFFLRDGLTCETPVESTYFFSRRLPTKRDINICSCCGLVENHIQKPTQEELDTYSGNVFYPCSECIKTRIPRPQPYRGSKRKRQTVSSLDPPASQRTIGEAAEESLVRIDGLDGPDTEPSGDFSEYDD